MPSGVYPRNGAKGKAPAPAASAASAFSAPGGARVCSDPYCRGKLGPSVDRHGQQVDECEKCGTMYKRGGVLAAVSTTHGTTGSGGAGVSALVKNCPVKGCPGRVDASGRGCQCCAKRAAFLERHLPKRSCEICGGDPQGRSRRFCTACGPVNTKVQVAKRKKVS